MLPLKPILRKGKLRKDETHLIYIQYCYNSDKRTLMGTNITIPIKFWHKKTLSISESLPSSYGNEVELSNRIKNLIRQVEDLVDFGKEIKTGNLIIFVKMYFDFKSDFSSIIKNT